MAKLTGQALVTRLVDRLGQAGTAAERLAALDLLNDAEKWFASLGSFKHLERPNTLTLANAANTVALPSWVDVGKTLSISLPNGNGELKVLPRDQFRRDTRYDYGAWALTSPTSCTISLDSTGSTQTVEFDRANATGGNLVYPFSAQQIPNTISDSASAGTGSSLPEGYEVTILLKRAEFEGKREIRAIVTDQERRDLEMAVAAFIDQYRSSKERPMPDSEIERRKVSEALAEAR